MKDKNGKNCEKGNRVKVTPTKNNGAEERNFDGSGEIDLITGNYSIVTDDLGVTVCCESSEIEWVSDKA